MTCRYFSQIHWFCWGGMEVGTSDGADFLLEFAISSLLGAEVEATALLGHCPTSQGASFLGVFIFRNSTLEQRP